MFTVSNLRSRTLLPHGSAPLHTIFKCPCSFVYLFLCVYLWRWGLCTPRPEELESQGAVSHRMWVLGTELGFSKRAAHALTLCASLQPLFCFCFPLFSPIRIGFRYGIFRHMCHYTSFAHNSLWMRKLSSGYSSLNTPPGFPVHKVKMAQDHAQLNSSQAKAL